LKESFPDSRLAEFAQRALFDAAEDWSSRDTGIQFRLVDQGECAVFALKYYRAPKDILAEAFFPDSKDRILYIFKSAFQRENRSYMSNVFRHEIGHILGLRHEDAHTKEQEVPSAELAPENNLSIMNYFTDISQINTIQESDVEAVRQLCSINEETFQGFEVVTVDPETLDQLSFKDSDQLSSWSSDMVSNRSSCRVSFDELSDFESDEPAQVDTEDLTVNHAEESIHDGLKVHAGVSHGEAHPVTIEEPRQGSSNEPTDVSTDEPSSTSPDETTRASIDEPTRGCINEPTRASINEPTQASTDEPTRMSTAEPTRVSADRQSQISVDGPSKTSPAEPTQVSADEPPQTSVVEPPRAFLRVPGQLHRRVSSELPPPLVTSEEQTDVKSEIPASPPESNAVDLDLQDALTPDPGFEDMFLVEDNPFAFSPGQLSKLINPKSISAFYALGGLVGLEMGLRTNRTAGLSSDEIHLEGCVSFEDAATKGTSRYGALGEKVPKPSDDSGSLLPTPTYSQAYGDGDTKGFIDRKRVFTTNRLPKRKEKSIIKLAWHVYYSQKVLIVLTLAVIISFAWDMRQVFLVSRTDNNLKTAWAQEVAILVCIIIMVATETLYQCKSLG
jgi:hypothetical protein